MPQIGANRNPVAEQSFAGMIPGSMGTFSKVRPRDVAEAFQRFRDTTGAVDWEMQFWTDHEIDDATVAPHVYAMRTDGLSPQQIQERRDRTIKNAERVKEWFFAPKRQGWPKPETKAAKHTRSGWEDFDLGDWRLARLNTRDIKIFIGKAMMSRDLDWEFKITMMEEPFQTGHKTPMWKITRIK